MIVADVMPHGAKTLDAVVSRLDQVVSVLHAFTVAAYLVAGVVFAVGVWLIVTDRRSRRQEAELTVRLMRHQPIDVQARHWLDQQP